MRRVLFLITLVLVVFVGAVWLVFRQDLDWYRASALKIAAQ